ncbi:hypothetical protein ACFQ9V_16205 [Leifsonia sp. NPDC056665]|uniref:hypothetical protein n=1 Tax=Leifsonia sp. NPDC056665 TaxID=3345901 RepID=UPI0036A53E85
MHTTLKAEAGSPRHYALARSGRTTPSVAGGAPAAARSHASRIRMIGADDTIVSVILDVSPIRAETDEIRLGGAVIGYITRAEHRFIASASQRPGSTRTAGTFDLWDKAAAELLLQRHD